MIMVVLEIVNLKEIFSLIIISSNKIAYKTKGISASNANIPNQKKETVYLIINGDGGHVHHVHDHDPVLLQ